MWYGLLLTLGLLLASVGLYRIIEQRNAILDGAKVTGRVVDFEVREDSDGKSYAPVFDYKYQGQMRRYTSPISSSPRTWQLQDEATLVVDAYDPGKIILLTYFGAFGFGTVLLAIGLLMIVIGGGYFWSQSFFDKVIAS